VPADLARSSGIGRAAPRAVRAVDPSFARRRRRGNVLKVLHPHLAAHAMFARRFHNEAVAASRVLRHAAVWRVATLLHQREASFTPPP